MSEELIQMGKVNRQSMPNDGKKIENKFCDW
jgi:hypothetical protein